MSQLRSSGTDPRHRDVPYTRQGKTIIIPSVTGDYCPACKESILDRQESERCMAAMRAAFADS